MISNVTYVGNALENASLEVTGCDIDVTSRLLEIGANKEGKVSFKSNKLSASTSRVIYMDRVSKKPDHDVAGVKFRRTEFDWDWIHGLNDKHKSKHTRSVKRMVQQFGKNFDMLAQSADPEGKYKYCLNCSKMEDADAMGHWMLGLKAQSKEKFRYCGKCRVAVYCSDKCKEANWKDHRLSCLGNRSI